MEIFQKARLRSSKGPSRGALVELRRRNGARLLALLRHGQALSRAEMARRTSLDPKTVTNLTNGLLREGLVIRAGREQSSGGRPAERLELNPDGALAVGIDLGATRLRTVLVDLLGETRISCVGTIPDRSDLPKLLRQIRAGVQKVFQKISPSSRHKVLGIGFASPGFLDRRAGVALEAVHLPGWKNVPIARKLLEWFALPVWVEESTRAAALGEQWYGRGREMSDFVVLDLGYGVGVGIISRGHLHRGVSESAGEIGHTTVKPDGTTCRCGKRGCLETIASGEAIARLSDQPTAEAAARAASEGDQRARRVINEAGVYLGMAVANLVNLTNPGMVILGGGLCNMGDLLIDSFTRSLREYALGRSLEATRVERSTLGELGGARGAASLALRSCFDPEAEKCVEV